MDQALLLWLNGLRSSALDGPLGFLGSWGYLGFPLLLAVPVLLDRRREVLRVVLDGWLSFLLGLFVVETVIKPLIGRTRPSAASALEGTLHVLGPASSSPSFPSGTATACAAAVAWLALRHRTERVGKVLLAVAIPLGLVTSLARIYGGAHWPSDVLVGWLFGALTAWSIHRATADARQRTA